MKRFAIFLLLLLPLSVHAQDCGNGLPCGPLPWSLPNLPNLTSPTPFPTVLITSAATSTPTGTLTATSTGTLTATPTITPTATGTSLVDTSGINDQVSTLQSIVSATQVSVTDRSQGFDLANNATNVFGYILGLQTIHFGPFTPLIQFLFFAFFLVIGLKIAIFLLPVFVTLFGFVRKVVETILDFIPG